MDILLFKGVSQKYLEYSGLVKNSVTSFPWDHIRLQNYRGRISW